LESGTSSSKSDRAAASALAKRRTQIVAIRMIIGSGGSSQRGIFNRGIPVTMRRIRTWDAANHEDINA